jgi:hypothetical protein
MPTHPIGPGTRNLSVNVRTPVHASLGRVANSLDVSMGELVRRLLRLVVKAWHASIRAERAAEYDHAALTKLRAAQTAESDGGATVTPFELGEVEELITKSARLDGRIAHAMNLREARA